MQWWNDFVSWLTSSSVLPIVTSVVLPFLAVLIAGIVAGGIGRGATLRLVAQRDRETRASAVASLITAGSSAASWSSLTAAQKDHSQTLANAADVSVRLLPIPGATLAADWAGHQLAEMRANSVNYSFQAEQTLGEYRDRLVVWMHKPGRAKKLFGDDLERWRYETSGPDPVAADQQRWAEEQLSARKPAAEFGPGSMAPGTAAEPALGSR